MLSRLKFLIVVLLAVIVSVPGQAQEVKNPPLTVEAVAGDTDFSTQMIITKQLQGLPRVGFFSVNELQEPWARSGATEVMTQGYATAAIHEMVSANIGYIWDNAAGFSASGGVTFMWRGGDVMTIVNPRTDIRRYPDIDVMALVEFTPRLSDSLGLYTRAQGLYVWSTEMSDHARSYLRLRAGLTIRDVSFGAAANFNFYGPDRHNENNFGGFVQLALF